MITTLFHGSNRPIACEETTFAYGVQSLLRTLRGLTLFVSIHDIENTFSSLSAFSVGLD